MQPGEFYYAQENGDRIPRHCTKEKCKMCVVTIILIIGFYFILQFVLHRWGDLQKIS